MNKEKPIPTTGKLEKSTNPFPVVGIGASAGGLDAFKKLIKAIPIDSGMAFVLVQHMNPDHESLLRDILQKVTSIPVIEIVENISVEPNCIYIVPKNKILIANDDILQLIPRPVPKQQKFNNTIDLFFSSLGEVYQSNAIGVVLSGTASDGTQGLNAIKDYGGITFAQDESSAAFEGMPQSAVDAGVVDFILPPEKIPEKILELTRIIGLEDNIEPSQQTQDNNAFKKILALLRVRKKTDFTYYKQTTIRRRIIRRMAFNKNEDPNEYLKYLRENKKEVDTLYQDMLIPVTRFFRDPKSFQNLTENVFPIISNNKDFVRIWVAGCSTGQEAYSIAMALNEYMGDKPLKAQIFATDLSEPAIFRARKGIYTKQEVADLSPDRLKEFFNKTDGNFQVKQHIRDMCIFALHNFLEDPPFGKIDLISCRNVLIYMEPYLQKRALTTFHYALNPGGYLLLGKSETSSSASNLFSQPLKNDKLFSRKNMPAKYMVMATQRSEDNFREINTQNKSDSTSTDFHKTADEILLSKFAPTGVVVNDAMDIVYFRGITSSYLEQSPGKPSHNLLKMAKPGLAFELRNILHKAKKDNLPVSKEYIPIEINGLQQYITIEAIPLANTIETHYLVLFLQSTSAAPTGLQSKSKLNKDEKDLRIQQLEKELEQAREDMRSISEEQESANEELQSANEELLSGNEELQSLNEELETGKEELQSTNEELTVVNSELISLNEQLTEARNFADAVIANVTAPMVILSSRLTVKVGNEAFYKKFQLTENETVGKLIFELRGDQWKNSELRKMIENILPSRSKITNFELVLNFASPGNRVMLLNAHEIIQENGNERLVIISLEDVTDIRQAKLILEEKNHELELMNKELQSFAYVSGHDLQEPLRKIQTFATRIIEKEHENLSANGQDYFRRMHEAAGRMQTLIEDLLAFSRLNSDKRKLEIISLQNIVDEVKSELKEAIDEKHAQIKTGILNDIYVIPFQFRQLLINLINNSLKFSKSSVPPVIKIESEKVIIKDYKEDNLQKNKTYIHLTISDNGIGFEPEFNEKIFEVFQRLHGKSEYAGTGIGLAIVRKIIDNHNGKIKASGEAGKGATFDIYLPDYED